MDCFVVVVVVLVGKGGWGGGVYEQVCLKIDWTMKNTYTTNTCLAGKMYFNSSLAPTVDSLK